MIKTWRVALHEYTKHVFSRRFLLGLLSVPLLITAMIGLIFLIIAMDNNSKPIGYVDLSGLLAHPVPPPPVEKPDRPVEIRAYADEAAAMTALEAGEIQAFYVLPVDYRTTGGISLTYIEAMKDTARYQFYNFLSVNLLADKTPEIVQRVVKGTEVISQSADGSRQISSSNWFLFLIPVFGGLALVIAMFTAGGYLMQAVVDEKENRTMEVILTSVSPNQFMAGKIVGDIAIGLTQILAWLAFIVIGILIGRNSFSFLKGIQIAPETILLMVFIMFPGFVMVAALMAAIGATVTEAREGQQMIGFISLPIWIPYMLTGLIIGSPNSPLVIGLSFFPLTAPLTMLIRDGMTIIPTWQIVVCSIIMILSAIGAIWLAGRAFRLGMLRYGKKVAWRELFVRQGAVS